MVKDVLQCRTPGFNPWVGKIPWRRAWQLTPVFLPGESPWAEKPGWLQAMRCKELDTTERLSTVPMINQQTTTTLGKLGMKGNILNLIKYINKTPKS